MPVAFERRAGFTWCRETRRCKLVCPRTILRASCVFSESSNRIYTRLPTRKKWIRGDRTLTIRCTSSWLSLWTKTVSNKRSIPLVTESKRASIFRGFLYSDSPLLAARSRSVCTLLLGGVVVDIGMFDSWMIFRVIDDSTVLYYMRVSLRYIHIHIIQYYND